MIFSALLLVSSQVVDGPPTSMLVDAGHEHDWVVVLDDPEGTAWVDENFRDSVTIDGVEHIEFLIRLDFKMPAMSGLTDLTLAADCKNKRLGISGGWGDPTGKTEPSIRRVDDEEIRWDFSSDPPHPNDLTILEHVCGRETV